MENFSKNKILAASFWNFMGLILIRAINYLSIPIFTRLLLPSELGIVSGYISYIALIGIFIGLGLNTSIGVARINYNRNYNSFNSSILYASFYWFIFVGVLANLTFNYYYPIIRIDRFWINYMLIAAFSGYVIDSFFKINTIDYKFKSNTFLGAANSICSLLLSIYLINHMSDKIVGRMLGQYLFYIVAAIVIFLYLGRFKPFYIERKSLAFAIPIGMPNMIHLASQTIMGQSDRVFILQLCDPSKVAIYSVAYTISSLLQVVWGAVNEVWTPWLFRSLKNENYDKIRQYSKRYLMLFSAIFAIVVLICPELTVFLSTPEYSEAKSFSPVIVLAGYFVFVYTFFVNIEIYKRENKYIAIATTIATVANIVGNIVLIPWFGYIAAAYTTLIAYFVLMIVHYIILSYVIKNNIYIKGTFIGPIVMLSLLTVFSVLNHDNIILRWGGAVGIVMALCIICLNRKKELIGNIKDIRKKNSENDV